MIKNYLKIALRSLKKNRTFSFINITGIATGITCCLLMVLYLQHELSFDKFQENGDRIVRVIMEYRFGAGEMTKGNFTSTKVFPAFKRNFPEVADGVRMFDPDRLVKYEEKLFDEKRFLYADSTFFGIFNSFKLLKGTPTQVLKNPKNVVVSASTAIKYFGSIDDAQGKIVLVGSNQESYLVTGVAEDCPANSQIKFDFLASFSSMGPAQEETYWDANYTTYLLLKDKEARNSLQQKIGPFMKKEMAEEGAYVNFELEPYTRVHLYSPYDAFEPNSSISHVYIIAAVAILILVIACFTYINLSTARSMERAREVGIRKVAGAFRKQVFWQFIGESLLVSGISLIISFILAAVLLPAFNRLAERDLPVSNLCQPFVVVAAICIVLVISLLAGSYPAIILSKFQPIKVLKGSFKNTAAGLLLRKSLIVFQFMISVFLVIATFIIGGQLQFIQNKRMGYDREHVIVMSIDQKIIDKIDLVKTELKTNQDILAVSKAHSTPVNILGGYSMSRADRNGAGTMNVKGSPIDEEYVKANKLEIIAGNDLTRQDILDASHEDYTKNYYHFLLNETAVRALGWKTEEAVGQKILFFDQRPGEIKGVVKDFHFASLHTPVQPLILIPGGWGNTLIIKTSGRNLHETIAFIEKKWKTIAPHRPFTYRFMDEDFQKLYTSETRTGGVFSIFAAIAILLACLGLFGLSAYAAQQRIKEIGVRKVLGASSATIVALLSRDFIKLVMVGFVLAVPIAWYFMNRWLQDFAYRIHIGWWIFIAAAAITILIALLTVIYQAVKAAIANPVKSLRTE